MHTVYFVLEGSEKRHSIDCDLSLTVEAMRESISSAWGILLQNIAISFNGERRGGRRVASFPGPAQLFVACSTEMYPAALIKALILLVNIL